MECLNVKYLSQRDISVPCGHCAFCLATRKSDWSTRLEYESKKWFTKKFITLTYADAHLHWKNGISQLKKSHLQDFFKRLRKQGHRLRYYAVGEYGSQTYRPHYHVILFGEIPDDDIRGKWPHGDVHIGFVNQASIAYCLKYIVNGRAVGMRNGRELPFALMSRRPGLGDNYVTPAMVDWHRGICFKDHKNYTVVDGQKRHLPRYYKLKIFSAIDRVRIAVRDQKAAELSLRKYLYAHRHLPNPLEYRKEQLHIAAQRVRNKTKLNLTH